MKDKTQKNLNQAPEQPHKKDSFEQQLPREVETEDEGETEKLFNPQGPNQRDGRRPATERTQIP